MANLGLHLNKLRLNKAICFDNASFTFRPGLSVIYGHNTTNSRTTGNGNGAGKSALVSQIGELLYEQPIVGQRQDAVKGGQRRLDLTIAGEPISVIRSGSSLKIKSDGKVKKFRTKPLARSYLKSLIPISQEEFNTYVHIDARIPHPLVMGSSTERRKFFTSFFGLDKLDIERKLFAAELSALSKVRAAYAEVLTEYKAASASMLSPEKLARLQKLVADEEATLEDLNKKNIKLQHISQLLAFEATTPQLQELRRLCPDGISVETFEDLVASAEKDLAYNSKGLADALEWEQYKRDNAHYTKAMADLSADALKLVNKLGRKAALEKAEASSKALRKIRAETEDHRIKIDDLLSSLAEPLPDKVAAPVESRGSLRADLEAMEHKYEHAKKFRKGTCETCGQSVKASDPAVIKSNIKAIEAALEQYEQYEQYVAAKNRKAVLGKELITVREALEILIPQIDKHKRYANLVDELAALPKKPRPFEGQKLEVGVKQRMVDEDKARLQLLRLLRPNLQTILDLENLTSKQRDAAPKAQLLQSKINTAHERLSKLRARVEIQAMAQTGVNRLKSRLKEMKAKLVNEKPLKLLVEAYSDKAMKKTAIKAISSRLMLEVNKYAKFVFSEDYTFEFQWDSSQLALVVHRKYGKRVLTSDVRKLSGAESKLFTLVLVLALLTFVPARKRCNCLILDEPASTFSLETAERFRALLPVLQKVIPTIVIVTPRTDERYEGAHEFTVCKTNGYATIVEGHPSSLSKGRS